MFQNSRVNIILRIVCLITFALVIIFNNSMLSLALITLFGYAFTRNDQYVLLFWWRIITLVIFLISYFTGYLLLLKIVLIIGLAYYFLMVPYKEVEKEEETIVDKYFLRFKKEKERKDAIDMNLVNAIYVTVHLFILFVTIMVG